MARSKSLWERLFGSSDETSTGKKSSSTGTMSREEAGKKGGEAPHVCRGRECSERDEHGHKEHKEHSDHTSRQE